MTSPTPRMPLPWLRNPEFDNDERPPMLVGDRFLVAVPLSSGGFDLAVIVADEVGFNGSDGDAWSAWDWSDVEFYIPLDGPRTSQEVDA